MPKRVLDFDAMWASDKIAACAEWAQADYAWCYGLADANGSFELTNFRVAYGKVAAIRKNLSFERFEQIVEEFHDKGLLFIWTCNGKRYGHWTGSDKPGRLPRESRRTPRYGPIFAPPVPKKELAAYVTECASRRDTKPVAPSNCDANYEHQTSYCDSKPVVGLGLGVGKGENHLGGAAARVSDKPDHSLPVADGFERFYAAYPRKKGRADAQKAWRKVKPEEVESILARLEIFKLGEWRGKDPQYIPYPATWLNGRRWEDEIERGGGNGGNGRTHAGAVPAPSGKYDAVPMVRASNVH